MKLVILRKGKAQPVGYISPGGYMKTAKGWRKVGKGKGTSTSMPTKTTPTKGPVGKKLGHASAKSYMEYALADIVDGYGNLPGNVDPEKLAKKMLTQFPMLNLKGMPNLKKVKSAINKIEYHGNTFSLKDLGNDKYIVEWGVAK